MVAFLQVIAFTCCMGFFI